jgi:hypothetical protein
MSGAPGAGKTLLARSLPSILTTLSLSEALDVTRIHPVADMLPPHTVHSPADGLRALGQDRPHVTLFILPRCSGRPHRVHLSRRHILLVRPPRVSRQKRYQYGPCSLPR